MDRIAVAPLQGLARLVDRAIDICVKPRATFREIDREEASFAALYRDYVLWLAALPPLAKLAVALSGRHAATVAYPRGLPQLAAGTLLDYVSLLAGVYALALAVNGLATLFGGERDEDRALRLSAYALTPSFLASASGAVPGLAWTSILGLYAIVLVTVGLPQLMRCGKERALGYGAAAAVAMAAIALALSLLRAGLLRM